jgi:Domain of unknown function (DUF4124)/WXXGXW repeat (2 copies)
MNGHELLGQGTRSAMDFTRWLLVSIVCLTGTAAMVRAGEIYKSIDANGNVVYSDHVDSSMRQTTEVHIEDPRFPPHEVHFCWTNCFTLVLDNGVYRRIDGTDETWTIETFTAAAVVLHRHDARVNGNGPGKDVVYAGQVANDRLIGATVNGKPIGGIDASWGSALNTLPGSNAERDAQTSPNLNSPGGAVSSTTAPPAVVEEEQPPLSQVGSIWTPGYWYWRAQGYFWIPGAWVRPPQTGLLWTPPYWSSAGAVFVFHPGHWGASVGYYGGVNYGHGYSGNGYTGSHPALAHGTYAASVASQGPRTVVQQTIEQAPTRTPVSRPAAIVKAPATNVPPKISHAAPSQAVPGK